MISRHSARRGGRRSLASLLVVACLAGALPVRADEPPTLESATRAYERLLYDDAAAQLRAVLARPDVPREERLEARRLLGIVEVIRENNEEARKHFTALLHEDPEAKLPPHLSPKITRFFDWVRSDLQRSQTAFAPSTSPAPPPSPAQNAPEPAAPRVDAETDAPHMWLLGAAGAGLAVGAIVGIAITAVALSQPPAEDGLVLQLP